MRSRFTFVQRQPSADSLDAGQRAERVALGRAAEAEQRPLVLAHLELGQDQDLAADRRGELEASAEILLAEVGVDRPFAGFDEGSERMIAEHEAEEVPVLLEAPP